MSSICTSNVTSGFIDLATFDELEKYMYGGPDATAYFVRETRKSTWFTQVPVVLSRASGQPAFGAEWSVSISRAGDYLMHTWLRCSFPEIKPATPRWVPSDNGLLGLAGTWVAPAIRWTDNLMHNLVRECCITFNDLVAARFDTYHLDFWAAFTVPAGKQNGYNVMIGNSGDVIDPVCVLNTQPSFGKPQVLPFTTLNLPLPLFFTRDSGVALPTAALPYNDMRINFVFREIFDLLVSYDVSLGLPVGNSNIGPAWPPVGNPTLDQFPTVMTSVSMPRPYNSQNDSAMNQQYQVTNCQVWANYAIVSNDERKRMACAPRDILIEQVQTAPRQTLLACSNPNPTFDIRFSHAIKVLFFAVRNVTCPSEGSNYTTLTSTMTTKFIVPPVKVLAFDPLMTTSLVYENTQRLAMMGSDYYSLVNPYYFAPNIPMLTGYHMYSYSLDFYCLDPMGSTNYGKLTNVSMNPEASISAMAAADGKVKLEYGADGVELSPPVLWPIQRYEFAVTAVNNNIIRVSGGALGFPVL